MEAPAPPAAAAAAADVPAPAPAPPVAAVHPPVAALPPPESLVTRARTRLLPALGAVVAVVVLAVVLPPLGRWLAVWWLTGGVAPPVVYALAHVVPTEPCMPVLINEMRSGTAVFGTVDLRNVRASLHHHLQYTRDGEPLQGISAQYLERHRICYALINMIYSYNDTQNLVEMYNMRIIGVSPDMHTRNTETSVLCEHPYETRRFQEITIEYWTAAGVRRMLDVFGVAAQTIQQVDDVQAGRGYCQDSNLEAQIERLQRMVSSIDRRASTATPFSIEQHQPRLPQRAT